MPINTAVSAVPVKVYTPAHAGTPTMFITNNGPGLVYLGGATVTTQSGLPLPAGQSLDISRMTFSVYGVSPYVTTATATTTSAASAAGATTVAVTSGTGLTTGSSILVGGTTSSEVVTITAGGGTTSLTTTATQFDHASGVAVTLVTPQNSSVTGVPGTV